MFRVGSISEGTLRICDLLEAGADELRLLNPTHPLLEEVDAYLDDGESEAEDWLWDDLCDALQEECPPYVYFGGHPGDPANIGFWPDWEVLEDDIRHCKPDGDGRYHLPDMGVVVSVSDHGNIEVYDLDGKSLWSCV